MTNNPFTFGNPIREPGRFIGRKEDIRQITNRLLSSARESTSIVGERRIGKTSLLKYLTNPGVIEIFGLDPEKFCLVYIDFQGLNDITPQRFWQRILQLMARSLPDCERREMLEALSKQEIIDMFDLEDLLGAIGSDDMHVVLLLDEFEYVTQNPNFDADFFGGLRSLAIHYNLSLVPATRRELVELCHSEEIKGSPFFNIFATVVLKPFTLEETNELVNNYSQSARIKFLDDEIQCIHEIGGGYPFFVQMICHYLVSGMDCGLKGKLLIDYAVEEFNQQADPHFAYIWSHATESERITLVTILALEQENRNTRKDKSPITIDRITAIYPRGLRDIVNLEKRGALVENDGSITLFSTSYGRWIGIELTAAPGEQEDESAVDKWIEANPQENLSTTKEALSKTKKKYWPIIGKVMKDFSVEIVGKIIVEVLMGFTR